jgi:hypothetical protein
MNYHRIQDGVLSIPMKRAEEKTKKPQNSPKGLTILKSSSVPEP